MAGMKPLISLFLLALLLGSCIKDINEGLEDPDEPLVFSSLAAEKDTIVTGESTKITAIATGYKITFHWSATAGDILGMGNQIVYAASPCQAGTNKISCTVRDGNNDSQSKEIFIVVN
jgi:hypothetical protein